MTIDEKIKKAAKACKNDQFNTGNVNLDKLLFLNREWGFFEGANFAKSEMLADMQKMAESLEDIINDLNNICGCSYDEQCTACFLKEKHENALAEFNAKYKGEK